MSSTRTFHPSKDLVLRQVASPTTFYGELEVPEKYIITHSFASDLGKQFSQTLERSSAFNRGYYLIGIKRSAFPDPPDVVLRRFLVAVSVRFGKRFDDMGAVVMDGHYQPAHEDRHPFTKFIESGFWNSAPRKNYPDVRRGSGGRPMLFENLAEILDSALFPSVDKVEARDAFVSAGSFYLNALRWVDIDLEKAYLDLVMAMGCSRGYASPWTIPRGSHKEDRLPGFTTVEGEDFSRAFGAKLLWRRVREGRARSAISLSCAFCESWSWR